MDDIFLARKIATSAGELLLKVRTELAHADPQIRKDAGDQRAHNYLVAELAEHRPDDAVLSEEAPSDDLSRLDDERVWIIDPLDGTREFGEIPRTDWAVHVALAVDGRAAVGAVALPALGMTLTSFPSETLRPLSDRPPRVIASRTRPGPAAQAVCGAVAGEMIYMGSAGAKAMAVVRGEAEIYTHTGGQYEWDNCAPVAVAQASGLHCSRIDGSDLVYNNENPYLPDLLICRTEFADAALGALAATDLG